MSPSNCLPQIAEEVRLERFNSNEGEVLVFSILPRLLHKTRNESLRGAEWYLEKRGSRKILAGSRNLGSVFDKSRSLVFSWFVFTFLSLENFHQRVSGSDF